jgi:hypothetical protein
VARRLQSVAARRFDMARTTLLAFFVSLSLAVSLSRGAFAGDHPYPPGKVTVTTPDDWKTSSGGDAKAAILAAVNPDQSAAIFITVTDAKDLAKAEQLLDNLLAPVIGQSKLDKPKTVQLNGMKGFSFEGSGKVKDTGKSAGILVLLLETPAHKVLLFVGLADKEKFAANKATLAAIVQSVKPLP